MIQLEQLQPNAAVRGLVPDAIVVVVSVQWFGSQAPWPSRPGRPTPVGPAPPYRPTGRRGG